MSEHVVWTQWDDLNVPANFKKLSPINTPAETGDLSEVTFYVPTYMGGYPALELSKKMPKLKVLQVPNAGYDDALDYLRPGITLCNGRGIHNDSTAELAVGLTIASLRGFVEFVRNQDQGEWVNNTYPITQLDSHLPTLDVVILILPLTKESKHLFDARRLALMKDDSLLVNMARGPVVDTEALIKELNSGRITAALDVTDPEPLPKDHPLWRAKGVLISPHVGGNSNAFEKRAKALIESQLKLLAEGKRLNNVITIGS